MKAQVMFFVNPETMKEEGIMAIGSTGKSTEQIIQEAEREKEERLKAKVPVPESLLPHVVLILFGIVLAVSALVAVIKAVIAFSVIDGVIAGGIGFVAFLCWKLVH